MHPKDWFKCSCGEPCMDGKTAVLALIEEAFINRPGSVADALTKFVED